MNAAARLGSGAVWRARGAAAQHARVLAGVRRGAAGAQGEVRADEKRGVPAAPEEPPARRGFLARLLAPAADGRSPVLAALGYYGRESRAIGAGRRLYEQAVAAAAEAPPAKADGAPFAARYEMLAVHVYVLLRRLRVEKGAPEEGDVRKAMQTMFDVFWSDVRTRMLIKEEGLKLIASGKWVKECEQRFFGMAMSFDECFDGEGDAAEALREPIRRNITCLEQDPKKVAALATYLHRQVTANERHALDDVWEKGLSWAPLTL